MTLIYLMERLLNALEKGEVGIGIFINFRNEFDTVGHAILPANTLSWYLVHGIQSVLQLLASNWANYLKLI